VLQRIRPTLTIAAGFLIGLVLGGFDHLMSKTLTAHGPLAVIVDIVDWTAPPIAGMLIAGALLVAQRYKRLHDDERAATRVLAERLAGTERRQAIWVVAAAIAHDLKNPLHNLQLLLEELEEADEDPERRRVLVQRIRENVDRASARVSELSRAGQKPEDFQQPVDISDALDDVHKRIAGAARAALTEVTLECPRGLLVRADALALRSAVENVVANALEALSARGGHLSLRARQLDNVVELVIEDDGPGIPERVRSRLFTPFSSGGESTGLGLAIARALARAGGGDLTCSDARPGRTAFRFTFPGVVGRLTADSAAERIAS
jgi:signal transduction histidine kinase